MRGEKVDERGSSIETEGKGMERVREEGEKTEMWTRKANVPCNR